MALRFMVNCYGVRRDECVVINLPYAPKGIAYTNSAQVFTGPTVQKRAADAARAKLVPAQRGRPMQSLDGS